ncbi:MAG: cellulose binding domain-containing protein [Reinekea sp.]
MQLPTYGNGGGDNGGGDNGGGDNGGGDNGGGDNGGGDNGGGDNGSGDNGGGVTISETIDSSWNGGYCETVTVTNTGGANVTWSIDMSVSGTVYTIWNGNGSQSGSTLSVSGVSWNMELAPGANTSFGFCANN